MSHFYEYDRLEPDWASMERFPIMMAPPEQSHSEQLIAFYDWYLKLRGDQPCLTRDKVVPRSFAPLLGYVSLFDFIGDPVGDFRFRVMSEYTAAVLGEKTGRLASETMTQNSFVRWVAAFQEIQAMKTARRMSAPALFKDGRALMAELLVVPISQNGAITQGLGSYAVYQDDPAVEGWPWDGDYLIYPDSPTAPKASDPKPAPSPDKA